MTKAATAATTTSTAATTTAIFGPPRASGSDRTLGLGAVVGHAGARAELAERVRSRTLPQGLLFSGPRGVGKRTLAQALAAEHFCERGRGCGECADCGKLERGNHPGLITVAPAEGKSSTPIDAIQELSRELSLRPQDERGRIVLLLRADRMTPPAQDALLKTLEEPPPGNVLVLTAVRLDALLATIRSRCQRRALTPLADGEVATVAQRLGISPSVPIAVAAGCPGLLAELVDPQLDRLRRGVAKLLSEERGRDDLAKWIALLHDGLADGAEKKAKDVEPAQLRARARLLLRFAGSFVRDAVVLRACAEPAMVRNSDQIERLHSIAQRPEWGDAIESLGRIARAQDRIEGNVDPASALFCALHPAADESARAGEA